MNHLLRRQFTANVEPNFLRKIQKKKKLKMSSAAVLVKSTLRVNKKLNIEQIIRVNFANSLLEPTCVCQYYIWVKNSFEE